MGVELLTELHASQMAGVLGCYDRMLIFGTLPGICYAGGRRSFLYARQVPIFDDPEFAEPFRDRIRENAEQLAAEAGIEIEFIRSRSVRKEDHAQELRAQRGDHPGLVCILSAMEPCSTYKPWHNKKSGKTYLVPNDGKCLHYYFYFVDEQLGLCHVRVPTWLPCRLQICLKWAQLAGGPVARGRDRISNGRPRLYAPRGLAKGTGHLRRLGSEPNPRTVKRVGAVLSYACDWIGCCRVDRNAGLLDLMGLSVRLPRETGA
jgi:hypothetical protein